MSISVPAQHSHPAGVSLQFGQPRVVGGQPLYAEAVGDAKPLRVVGDSDVLIAALLGCRHHHLYRVAPVAPVAVNVQVAAQVRRLHQRGDCVIAGQRNLGFAHAQLRRNVLQTKPLIDGPLFGELFQFARFDVRYAVLIERQPHSVGVLAQQYVVMLRAGEVLEQRAELARRHGPKIHL